MKKIIKGCFKNNGEYKEEDKYTPILKMVLERDSFFDLKNSLGERNNESFFRFEDGLGERNVETKPF